MAVLAGDRVDASISYASDSSGGRSAEHCSDSEARQRAGASGGSGGASVNPDQSYFGGHIETPPVADRLRFRPNVEIGVGSGVTLAAFNLEFIYPFPARHAWHVYAGGGPALNWYKSTVRSDTKGA